MLKVWYIMLKVAMRKLWHIMNYTEVIFRAKTGKLMHSMEFLGRWVRAYR